MKKSFIKMIVAIELLLGSMYLVGCGQIPFAKAIPEAGVGIGEIEDDYETGAWKEGMFWCGEYQVNLSCPEAGHPSGSVGSEWSTSCKLEDGTSVDVDFFSREGSIEDRIAELEIESVTVEEGVLWENHCDFYRDDAENVTIVFVKVDEENYIEITFESWEENAILFEEIPNVFTLTITDKF